MSKVCRFTVPASRDIEGIIDYIADVQSLDAADRLLDTINNIQRVSFETECV
jgi:toxin ParE1/3/4